MKRELSEKQELYLSMVSSADNKKIDALNVRRDTKRNIKLVYGFFIKVGTKGCDYTKLQNTGRQANVYRVGTKSWDKVNEVGTKSWDKVIITTFRTISSQVGISKNSVSICIQHIENLGLIEVVYDEVGTKSWDKVNEVGTKSWDTNTNTNTSIDNITDLELKHTYNKTFFDNFKLEVMGNINELEERLKSQEERIEELVSVVNELKECLYRMEDRLRVVESVGATKAKNSSFDKTVVVDSKQAYSNRRELFWDKWNKYMSVLRNGRYSASQALQYYKAYYSKVENYFSGQYVTTTRDSIKEQFLQGISVYGVTSIEQLEKMAESAKREQTFLGEFYEDYKNDYPSNNNTEGMYEMFKGSERTLDEYTSIMTKVFKQRACSGYANLHIDYFKTRQKQ